MSLTVYFLELVASLASLAAKQFLLDGEIVVSLDGTLSMTTC